MKKTGLIFSILLFVSQLLHAQYTFVDATALPTADEVNLIRTKIIPRSVTTNNVSFVPIQPHIVRASNGNGGITIKELNEGLSVLNHYYINSGIQFFFISTVPHYIDDDNLYEYQTSKENLLISTESTNAINLYIVDLIDYIGGSEFVWGLSRYPNDQKRSNRIFVKSSEVAQGFNLLQTFGHYFGLMNTYGQHEAALTNENADGSNCSDAGDLICDTKADPFSNERKPLSSDFEGCLYVGKTTDNIGELFTPPVDNFMSVYPASCKTRYTPNQYTRMAQTLAERRTHTSYSLSAVPPSISPATALTAVLSEDKAILNWSDNAINETGYIIERSEISRVTGFVAVKGGGVAPDATSFIDNSIKANKTYYYRIRPSNSITSYSNVTSEVIVPLVYCKPTYTFDNCTSGSDLKLTGVKIQDESSTELLNNTSDCSTNTGDVINNFTYYKSTPVDIVAGSKYSFTFSTNSYQQHVSAWIDFNRDGDFTVDELILQTTDVQQNITPKVVTNFQIPINIKNGKCHMRVRTRNGSVQANVTSACDEYSLGETEDYEINLLGGISDLTPPVFISSTPSITNVLISGFDVNVVMNEKGLVYFIVVPKGTNTLVTPEQVKLGLNADWQPAVASGTIEVDAPIKQFSRTVSGLQPGAAYDLYVIGEDISPTPNVMITPVKVDGNTIIPVANFTTDRTVIYQGQEVIFTDLSTGAGNRWSWTFGDGGNAVIQNPKHTFENAGLYTVELKINDGLGFIKKEGFIHVIPNREVPYLASDGGNFEVNLNDFGTVLETGSTQLWQHGAPTGNLKTPISPLNAWKTIINNNVPKEKNKSALQTPNFDFSVDGEYYISFYKSMENLFYDGPYAVQVEYSTDKGENWTRLGNYEDPLGENWYNSNPANPGISSSIIADQQGWLLSVNNEKTRYNVTFLNGERNVAFRFVMYVDKDFGIDSFKDGFMLDDFEVQFIPPTPLFSSLRQSIFPGESIEFQDASIGATSWLWDFGDGETSTSQNPTHTYTRSGQYSVKLIINGDEQFRLNKSNYIFVLDEPSIPYMADFEESDFGFRQYIITGAGDKKWQWGSPTSGFYATALRGEKCWSTMTNEKHGTNTKYALESPVFNLAKGRGEYFLEFEYRAYCGFNIESGKERAGMRLDYRVDGGAWKPLGTDLQGKTDINAKRDWYNSAEVEGLNGEMGWHSASTNLYHPLYDISEFTKYNSVQFRFVFGSENIDGPGFQIDNFAITGEQISIPGLWRGEFSNNWSDRLNWDNELVPNSTTEVIIKETPKAPIIHTDVECGNLTISAGVELQVDTNITLHVFDKLHIKANRNNTSSIFSKGTVIADGGVTLEQVLLTDESDFITQQTSVLDFGISSRVVYRYNELVSNSWENFSKAKVMEGYSALFIKNTVADIDTFTLLHTGDLNSGEHGIALTHHNGKAGYNLVGNPFPCYIDWNAKNAWEKDKMLNSYWLKNSSRDNYPHTFGSYNGLVGVNGATNIVKPGKSFYVMSTGTGSLTVNENAKIRVTEILGKKIAPHQLTLYLNVKSAEYTDQIAIAFHIDATDSIDQFDMRKIKSNLQEVPNLYSWWGNKNGIITGEKLLSINFQSLSSLLDLDNIVTIPIGVSIGKTTNLSISADNINEFKLMGYNIYLRDNEFHGLTDLAGNDYQFLGKSGDITKRFEIIFTTHDLTLSVSKVLQKDWKIYNTTEEIIAQRKDGSWKETTIQIIDLQGRTISFKKGKNNEFRINAPIAGIYLVKVTDSKGSFTKRILIR